MESRMAMAHPPHGGFFLGSGSHSGGGRMLSFSSTGSSDAGLGCGSSDVTSMQGVLARVRGPFTPTQWMELEHQALIYKHIVANAPVPAGLLLPIRRSLHPPVFPHLSSGGTPGSSSLGWGSLQLGYSGSTDPEPGRCRRTDGKKWRCSRDAVVDQKYCERHINRGRQRSRKHVEGRSSQAAKEMIAISQPAFSSGKSSGSHAMEQQPVKSLATNLTASSPTQIDRMLLDKGNVSDHAQDSTNQKYLQVMFPNIKGVNSSEETPSQADYTIVSTGPTMNALRSDNLNLQRSHSKQAQPNPLQYLFGKEIHPDGIQLSISIPTENSNFPNTYDQAQIGLGVSTPSNEGNGARASWMPVSWETSTDGPLGEFFTNTSNASDNRNKSYPSPSLNLLTDGCTRSPQLHSPTGVLQMISFGSVSSSTVSSPGSLCNGLLAPSLVNPQTVQTL